MAADAFAALYVELDSDSVLRSAIGRGDFGAFEADLDDAERKILVDVAGEELPDVSGFSLGPDQKVEVWAPYNYVAQQYITRNVTTPATQAMFLNWKNQQAIDPTG